MSTLDKLRAALIAARHGSAKLTDMGVPKEVTPEVRQVLNRQIESVRKDLQDALAHLGSVSL